MWRLISVLAVLLCLDACAPNAVQMGIKPSDWAHATEIQKTQWRDAYLFYKKIHPELPGNSRGSQLVVHVDGGAVLFPPYFDRYRPYKPLSFVLFDGQCRYVPVVSVIDPAIRNTLYACFARHTLALDPSRVDKQSKNGSLIVNHSPLWQRTGGWVYESVNSSGYLSLNHVNIRLELKKFN